MIFAQFAGVRERKRPIPNQAADLGAVFTQMGGGGEDK